MQKDFDFYFSLFFKEKQTEIIIFNFPDVGDASDLVEYAKTYGLSPNWQINNSSGRTLVWILEEELNRKQYEMAVSTIAALFEPFFFTSDFAAKEIKKEDIQVLKERPLPPSFIGYINMTKKIIESGSSPTAASRGKKDLSERARYMTPSSTTTVSPLWYEELYAVCPSWRMWQDGVYLNKLQRQILWNNLRFVKKASGDTTVSDIYKFYREELYKDEPFSSQDIVLAFQKTRADVPICDNDQTAAQFLATNIRKPNTIKVPLDEVEKKFIDALPQIMEAEGMDYIEVQTAMGKTEQYIRWLKTRDLSKEKIVIAATTYNLLEDIKQRILKHNPDFKDLIYLPEPATALNAKQTFNLRHGRPSGRENSEQRAAILSDLMGIRYNEEEERREAYKKPGLYLISHAALANAVGLAETDYVIIDENIENSIRYEQDVNILNIANIKDGLREDKHYLVNEFIEAVEKAPRGQTISNRWIKEILTNPKERSDYHFSFAKFRDKQLGLEGCEGLYYMLDYKLVKTGTGRLTISGRKPALEDALSNGAKVKLFSASPQTEIMKRLFPSIRIHNNFGYAANKGVVTQYTGITGAKGHEGTEYASAYMDFVSEVIDKENTWILTHKNACSLWESNGFKIPNYIDQSTGQKKYIHIGNCEGLDWFNGDDVAVVGKLELNPASYQKIWYLFEGTKEMPKMKSKYRSFNGIATRSMLYEDDFLQKVQLEHLNKAVSQAAGRARALRQDSKVYVFGNYIIKEADIVIKPVREENENN